MKKAIKKRKKKSFAFPIFAMFTLTLCAVVAMLLVDKEETSQYFNQLNFIPDEKTICIDAGHGGADSGALGDNGKRLEKDDTLRLSLIVRDELLKKGYKVVMTREDDSTVNLNNRPKIANKNRASLFVSIHRNSGPPTGKGVEIWIHSKNPTDDNLLATNILDEMEKAKISKNRGIHTGYREGNDKDYCINRSSKMPSCLCEIGFITNDEDNKDFDEKLNEYAKAIANGIEKTSKEMYSK